MGYFMSKIMLDFTWLLGRLRRIYFMALPENEGDYEKSRKNFIAGDSANQTIAQLAGGTFLVSLMLSVHIPDASIGVITSMGSLAALFQLFTMQPINKLKKRKLFVCITVLQKLFFSLIFFVPLLPLPFHIQQFLIVAGYFLAQAWSQIGTPATQDWIASLVPMELRGKLFLQKRRCGRICHSNCYAGRRRDYGQYCRRTPACRLSPERDADFHPCPH